MEILDSIASVLKDKDNNQLWSIEPDDRVYDAITLMSLENVGALPVMNGDDLVGIISERDYARKVILQGRSSKQTKVHEIMTTAVYFVPPTARVVDSMHLMTEKKIRHLPVMEDEKVIGIVSIGDLVHRLISSQEDIIEQLESYLCATYPTPK